MERNIMGRYKMRRKGMMRTLEAVLAFFLTFTFLVYITQNVGPIQSHLDALDILPVLEMDDAFRYCVTGNDVGCMTSMIEVYMPGEFEFQVVVDNEFFPPEDRQVITESLFIVGNQTNIYKIVRLYYWPSGLS